MIILINFGGRRNWAVWDNHVAIACLGMHFPVSLHPWCKVGWSACKLRSIKPPTHLRRVLFSVGWGKPTDVKLSTWHGRANCTSFVFNWPCCFVWFALNFLWPRTKVLFSTRVSNFVIVVGILQLSFWHKLLHRATFSSLSILVRSSVWRNRTF